MLTNGKSPTLRDEDVSLYIHIPFCRKKCSYCHFFVIPDHSDKQALLFQSLLKEWEKWRPQFQGKKLVSIYFGGGTPILWKQDYLSGLLNKILSDVNYDPAIEITLEANPEEVTPSRCKELVQSGINRVSVGIQSYDDNLLQLLGRQHSGNKAIDSLKIIADAGIRNISADAMYDLPDQSFEHWERTLHKLAHSPITHVSLYNLTIEPQTLFYKNRGSLSPRLPPEEESVRMYAFAREFFAKNGFEQYEISAFAKPAYEAIHNSGYWTGRPFIGLGPSAFSFWEGSRFQNVAHLEKYAKAIQQDNSPIDFQEKLKSESHLREYIAVRLRLLTGFELPSELPSSIEKDLLAVEKHGWIKRQKDFVKLTDEGILFYDSLAAEII